MAHQVPARLTPREGRRFALTVGLAFLVLSMLSLWRGHDTAPIILGALGVTLLLAGLAFPNRLGPVHRGWMAFGLMLSKVTTPIFMGLLYFVAITPVALAMRAFGRRPLKADEHSGGFWAKHESSSNQVMTRQY